MSLIPRGLGLTRYEADEYYKMALDFYKKGQFDDAVDHITYAIEALPSRAEFYATRGFFYLEDGLPEKAKPDFEAALKRFNYELLAHYGLGMIAYKAKQWDEALAHFQKAYFANQQRPETLYYLALTHHHKRENDKALTYMEQAQAIFEEENDRRRTAARQWVSEFKKRIDDETKSE